ncbi:MAG: hypothetical protein HN884_13085 [Rhodospirillaceae bacterium]|jgi:hypothetical protein|nr:hypothetical protein [Rhodospirillaceae bacterium]
MSKISELWEKQSSAIGIVAEEQKGLVFLNSALAQVSLGGQHSLALLYPLPGQAELESDCGAIYPGRIRSLLEEYVFRIGVELPLRTIDVELFDGESTSVAMLNPKDKGLLPGFDNPMETMFTATLFHRAFLKKLGELMSKSLFDLREAHLSAVLFVQSEGATDVKGMAALLELIGSVLPPAYRYFAEFQNLAPVDQLRKFEPMQSCLYGFLVGLPPAQVNAAWSFQSYLLHANQDENRLLLQFEPAEEFFHACRDTVDEFFRKHPEILSSISGELMLEKMPDEDFSGTDGRFEHALRVVCDNWGWPENLEQDAHKTDRLMLNACLIYVVVAEYAFRN